MPLELQIIRASEFIRAGARGHPDFQAVLYGADPYHGARMFAFISKQRGWSVQAFGSYEEALNWLALTEEPIPTAEAE